MLKKMFIFTVFEFLNKLQKQVECKKKSLAMLLPLLLKSATNTYSHAISIIQIARAKAENSQNPLAAGLTGAKEIGSFISSGRNGENVNGGHRVIMRSIGGLLPHCHPETLLNVCRLFGARPSPSSAHACASAPCTTCCPSTTLTYSPAEQRRHRVCFFGRLVARLVGRYCSCTPS